MILQKGCGESRPDDFLGALPVTLCAAGPLVVSVEPIGHLMTACPGTSVAVLASDDGTFERPAPR